MGCKWGANGCKWGADGCKWGADGVNIGCILFRLNPTRLQIITRHLHPICTHILTLILTVIVILTYSQPSSKPHPHPDPNSHPNPNPHPHPARPSAARPMRCGITRRTLSLSLSSCWVVESQVRGRCRGGGQRVSRRRPVRARQLRVWTGKTRTWRGRHKNPTHCIALQ